MEFQCIKMLRILSRKSGFRNVTTRLYSTKETYTEVFQSQGVRNIVMSHEKTRNSLSVDMMDQLIKNIVTHQEYLRVILLSSNGPVWSAGHNLRELNEKGPEDQLKVFNKLVELIKTIQMAEVPIVAQVDGIVAAAGVQLMAHCDMVIASDKSEFSCPGANVGIFCSTPGIALVRTIPKMKTSYMLFTGLPIKADEALRVGLVSAVVPSNKMDEEVTRICEAIKFKSRDVVNLGKKFFYEQISMNLDEAYEAGTRKMVENCQMDDGKEGIKSFIEKRKPKWKFH